ncbi:MAG TPA: hypothetical protein VJJ98_13500 [Sedimentisphaerales bacterium]|nr:hypothetical protein [Sedimentisphaerales bacterium]
MWKQITSIVYVMVISSFFARSLIEAEDFDPEVISQVSKRITEWKLMNNNKSATQTEPTIYVSSSLSEMVEKTGRKRVGLINGLTAFDGKPYDFIEYINKPTHSWYPVDSMGIPGGWGAKPLPGEKIYDNIDDPVTYIPSWRNITPIPSYGSTTDPLYQGGSAVGMTLAHIEWGPGNPRKIYGTGGHTLKSYDEMAGPLQTNRIRAHSQGGLALYNLHTEGGWASIEPFLGKTIRGVGHSPLDVENNQIATGGYWSNPTLDVATRSAHWNFGSSLGNPLKLESDIGRWNTGMGSISPLPSIPTSINYPSSTGIGLTPYGLGIGNTSQLPSIPKMPIYTPPRIAPYSGRKY